MTLKRHSMFGYWLHLIFLLFLPLVDVLVKGKSGRASFGPVKIILSTFGGVVGLLITVLLAYFMIRCGKQCDFHL